MTEKKSASFTGATRIVLAIAMAGTCAFAQQAAEAPAPTAEETALPAVTVSANDGAPVAIENTGVSVTVLNVEDLKEEGVYSLGNALTEVPGVYTLPGGGLNQVGNYNKAIIRGMNADAYTLVTTDGMRINNTSSNVTGNIVGRTNLLNIGTLEVLRGSQAAVYGGGAIGGVIFMDTPEGKGEPSYEIFNEAGSFDTYTGSITAQGQVDKLSYFVNALYSRTGNDLEMADGSKYDYVDHAGKSETWQESLRLDYALNEDNKTTMTYRREDSEYMSPDFGQMSYMSNLVTAKHESKVSSDYTTSLMAGYYGNDYNLGFGTLSELRNVQIEWRNNYIWDKQNSTKAGFAWNRSDYQITNVANPNWLIAAGKQESLDNVYGVYVGHTLTPVKNWSTDFNVRLDSSSQFDENFTFRVASSYKFNQDKTRVFASVGSGYDTPTDFERFVKNQYYYGTYYNGNENLDVATSISFDLGIEQEIIEDHKISATYFWIQESDRITQTDTVYDEFWNGYCSFVNADQKAKSQGLELALTGIIEKNWNTSYTLSYTYTQAKWEDGDQVPDTARQLWSVDINTKPTEQLTVGAGLTAASGRTDAYGYDLDAYYLIRLYASYALNENISFHLRLENITNQKFICDYANWAPSSSMINSGAAVYGGCTIKF